MSSYERQMSVAAFLSKVHRPVTILAILGWIITIPLCWIVDIQVSQKVDAFGDRAKQCAKAEEMIPYLKGYIKGMEEQGITTGHAAWFFPSPSNSYAEEMKQVKRLISRCQEIAQMDTKSLEYQQAQRELRIAVDRITGVSNATTWHRLRWMIGSSFVLTALSVAMLVYLDYFG